MTATPERTDGFDIFALFNHNIAYEIRLQKAMEAELLSPFHYFGVTDILVNGEALDEKSDFGKLISSDRVEHIIKTIDEYGCDTGNVRGLVFCSRVEEARELSNELIHVVIKLYQLQVLTLKISEKMLFSDLKQMMIQRLIIFLL